MALINIRGSKDLPERKEITVRRHEEKVILLDDRKPRLFNKQRLQLQRLKSKSQTEPVETAKARQVTINKINTESKKATDTSQKFNAFSSPDGNTSQYPKCKTKNNITAERGISPGNKLTQAFQEIDVKNIRASVMQRLRPKNSENLANQKEKEQTTRQLNAGVIDETRQSRALSPIYEPGAVVENTTKTPSLQALLDTKKKVGAVIKLRTLKNKQTEDENQDDYWRYNPDGSLRTMYKKQDFRKSIAEAKKN